MSPRSPAMASIPDDVAHLLTAPIVDHADPAWLEQMRQGSGAEPAWALALEARTAVMFGQAHIALRCLHDLGRWHFGRHPFLRWMHANLNGIIIDDLGDFRNSLSWFRYAAAVAESSNLFREENISRQNIARSACRLADPVEVERSLIELSRFGPSGPGMHEALGEIFELLGDERSALRHYEAEDSPNGSLEFPALAGARTLLTLGHHEEALRAIEAITERHPDDMRLATLLLITKATALIPIHPANASELAANAVAVATSCGFNSHLFGGVVIHAEANLKSGNAEAAARLLTSVDIARLTPQMRARAHEIHAETLWTLGRRTEALEHREKLRATYMRSDELRSLAWQTWRDLVSIERETVNAAALEPINAQLEQANEAMQVAAAQTAHDLRSGLGVLKMALESPTTGLIRRLAASALVQMSEIAEQIQWASTVDESGRLAHDSTANSFDLTRVVERSIAHFRPIAQAKHQTLLADLQADTTVQGAPFVAVQIANNLIENAVHYTPQHGQIQISIVREQDELVFRVRDTGVGIPRGDEERIFGRFARAATPTSNEPSSGLGLYIVRSGVQRLGGSVSAQSNLPDPGSTFEVRLPSQSPPGNRRSS